MTLEEASEMQVQVPKWEIIDEGHSLRRIFTFGNHYEVMAFANAIAWISHREDHHPSLTVGYSRCEAVYSTPPPRVSTPRRPWLHPVLPHP